MVGNNRIGNSLGICVYFWYDMGTSTQTKIHPVRTVFIRRRIFVFLYNSVFVIMHNIRAGRIVIKP